MMVMVMMFVMVMKTTTSATSNCVFHALNKTQKAPTLLAPIAGQGERAAAIGAMLAALQPDVVNLQEVWGTSLAAIEAPIADTHRLVDGFGTWGLGDVVDTAAGFLGKKGGLWSCYVRRAAGEGEVMLCMPGMLLCKAGASRVTRVAQPPPPPPPPPPSD